MNISVAGTGYVGLVTGVCLAYKGHDVTCVDVDENKINRLNGGDPVIYEHGLRELQSICMEKKSLRFTTDYESAYRDADAIIIGVGTPEKKDGSVNLSYIYKVIDEISRSIERDCTVIIKSTVPVGTSDKVESRLRSSLRHKLNVEVASNPEFLAQGSAVKNTLCPDRIIIGVESEHAKKVMLEIYEKFDSEKIVTHRHSAELIKYASNDFLALKISYVNELANLCELTGADIDDVARGMGTDPRIGKSFLKAGTGYGGSCFPKDTKALSWMSNFHGYEMKTVRAAIDVNENQKYMLIKKARRFYDDFSNVNVAVLGLTFKPGTDDLREAPSLTCIPFLLEDRANIKAWDPVGEDNYRKIYNDEIKYCKTIDETIEGADICFIFTEWPDIVNMDVSKFRKLMKRPLVLDGRNCFDLDRVRGKGVRYISIGRMEIEG